ncbi:MAG: hypothetical protein M4D80_11285 [Myxococcota bacterium]|nr:hypothetical protein [Deltaproteobacteria bacterium]MDQ3335741.1 hypothetical protein [Myxococcota bacterium]
MKSLALALVLFGSACATDGSPETDSRPKQLMQTSGSPTFTLFVSNQSLDKTLVDLQISIDGQLAVSGDFNVFSGQDGEGCGGGPLLPQHNWYEFNFALPAGAHQITAIHADGTATFDTTVAQRYGVLDFWYDATTDEPEHFNFFSSDSQPAFQ